MRQLGIDTLLAQVQRTPWDHSIPSCISGRMQPWNNCSRRHTGPLAPELVLALVALAVLAVLAAAVVLVVLVVVVATVAGANSPRRT